MALGTFDIYNGISCIILVFISVSIGVKIVLKYFKNKQRVLIYAGIAWIFMSETWWAPTTSFIVLLLTGNPLPIEIFFIISVGFIPFALLIWLAAFTELVYNEKQKIILIIFAIEGILFEIFSLYFIFTNPDLIITRHGAIDGNFHSFVLVYLISILIIILITGLLFARNSVKSDDPEIRLKGKILIVAFVSFIIGGILDAGFLLSIETMILYRILLISSAFEFYFGLFLPKWIKKLFLREE